MPIGIYKRISKKIKMICKICKKEFSIHPSAQNRRKCCSRKCRYIFSSQNYKGRQFSEEAKRKNRLAHLGKQGYWKGKKLSKEHRQKLSNSRIGKRSPNYKNGKAFVNGYVLILNRQHPFCNCRGYVKQSRLVAEKILNRFLKPTEIIHHINNIRNDDRPENLYLFKNKSKHTRFHHFFKSHLKSNLLVNARPKR